MSGLIGLTDYSNPNSLGSRLRRRRRHYLAALIDLVFSRRGRVKILDIGGRRQYWAMFDDDYLRSRQVHITLINSAHELGGVAEQDARFTAVPGDGCSLPQYQDNSFDLTHSNSTIEHVGGWERMEAFARESRRLAPAYYLQTPYFWFPVEPHFMAPFYHWLPENWRAKLLLQMRLGHHGPAVDMGDAMRQVRSARLLDKAQLTFLLPDASIRFEWLGPFPKSLIATKKSP
jgi:hypothetical protein